MSTVAVENSLSDWQASCGSGTAPGYEEVEMRIVETLAAGAIALASQFLIVAAVLL
jgi:hypothetical protein